MSNIEWTDETWNPVIGCAKVAQGCKHCYAEKMSKRLRSMGQSEYGDVLTIEGQFNGQIRTRSEMLDKPLRWKKPRMVFVNSMSDLFHEDVPFEFIAAVYGVMAACPKHTFQVLTKRPERMREFFEWWHKSCPRTLLEAQTGNRLRYAWATVADVAPATLPQIDAEFPLPNVWHVVSASTQPELDENVRVLLQVPSAIRGVSLEPLVEAVVLREPYLLGDFEYCEEESDPEVDPDEACAGCAGNPWPKGSECRATRGARLDWVIVGGESGPGARPFDIAWARSIIQQCEAANVPVFVKQLGSRPVVAFNWEPSEWPKGVDFRGENYGVSLRLKDKKGANPSEWPEDLRVREFPKSGLAPSAQSTPKKQSS